MRSLFVGRFQPLHWGHVKVVEWLLSHYDEVVIAIGSANKAFTFDNPFTPGERIEMFRRHFGRESRLLYCSVPDTSGQSSIWGAYLRHWCPQFHVLYSNNPHVEVAASFWGIEVKRHPIYGNYSGTVIRQLMALGDSSWREFVPPAVVSYIEEIGGVERMKALKLQ